MSISVEFVLGSYISYRYSIDNAWYGRERVRGVGVGTAPVERQASEICDVRVRLAEGEGGTTAQSP